MIDGLRGLAALIVYLFHSTEFFGDSWRPASGYLAVDLFFLLSGIVIAYSYDGRIGRSELGTVAFMRVRLVRFYPLLILATLATAAVQLVAVRTGHLPITLVNGSLVLAVILTLLFIPQRPTPNSTLYPLNAPFWSLLDELLINACFILAWRWLSNSLLAAVIVIGGIGLAFIVFHYGDLAGGPNWDTPHVGLVRVTFSFFVGVLMVRTIPRSTRRSDLVLVAASIILGLILFFDPGRFRPAYDLVCVIVLFPLLAVLAIRFQAGPRGSRPACWLGDASYGIYVFHAPFNGVILGLLGMLGFRQVGWLGFVWPMSAAMLIVFMLVLNRYFDVPLRRWLLRPSGRGDAPPF